MRTSSVTKTPKTSSNVSQSKDPLSKVRVIVRVRPFLHSEILDSSETPLSCISTLDSEYTLRDEVVVQLKDRFTSRQECYKVDSFYSEESSVSEIFQKEVTPLISGIFHGSNATVFACGATGSGKTHTMQGTNELPGLMPLSMSMILNMCASSGNIVEMSYYEVYMDKCYDLLDHKQQEISVLDDKDGLVHLRGLSRIPVTTISQFQQILAHGVQKRKVAHTELNDISSRSHGVLVIAVSSPPCNGSGSVVLGKLNLIDLAGNEDNRRTGNEGIRLQESSKINRSLFALSNVICALNNNEARVPYRESKLTRILQDSLGGKSRSLMVACLNPSEYQLSVNTVTLASRSRRSTSYIPSAKKEETPTAKIDMEAKLQAWLESKGKLSRSAHKMIGFGSPRPSKTPLSTTRSIKKQSSCQSYRKIQHSTYQGLANAKRNLFKSEAPIGYSMEMSLHESCSSVASKSYAKTISNQDVEEYKDCSSIMQTDGVKDQLGTSNHMEELKGCPGVIQADKAKVSTDEVSGNKDTSPCKGHLEVSKDEEDYYKDCSSVMQVDCSNSYNDKSCGDEVASPCKDHLNAFDDVGKHKVCFDVTHVNDEKDNKGSWGDGATSPSKDQFNAFTVVKETKEYFTEMQVDDVKVSESCQVKITSQCKDHINACNDISITVDDCSKEDIGTAKAASLPDLKATLLPEELLKKEKSTSSMTELKTTPLLDKLKNEKLTCTPLNEKTTTLHSARRVLSPIENNSDLKTCPNTISKTPVFMLSCEPKTPKTPRVFTSDGYGFQGTSTPLDKYNVRSSNLKTSIAREYIEFLNSASKEELLKLKGIGHKRAEYILHLRETMPLESLNDLEKIGLSAKQVKSMFRRAAKGIFDD